MLLLFMTQFILHPPRLGFPFLQNDFFQNTVKNSLLSKIVCIFTAVKAPILYEKLALWLNIFFYF